MFAGSLKRMGVGHKRQRKLPKLPPLLGKGFPTQANLHQLQRVKKRDLFKKKVQSTKRNRVFPKKLGFCCTIS